MASKRVEKTALKLAATFRQIAANEGPQQREFEVEMPALGISVKTEAEYFSALADKLEIEKDLWPMRFTADMDDSECRDIYASILSRWNAHVEVEDDERYETITDLLIEAANC